MIKQKTIRINKKKYILKAQSYRAMFLYEELTEKPISELNSFKDQVTFIYCVLKVSNDNFEMDLEQFFDVLENDDSVIHEFAKLNEKKK